MPKNPKTPKTRAPAAKSPRAVWEGTISFSLVAIPVALYPATRREELRFHLLRDNDLSRINNKRIAQADGQEVPWEHIVKGYEYEKGKFVVLKDEDFRRADVEATQTIDIIDFVALDEIDPMYFDKPYYLEPQKGGDKSYALLRECLRQTGKVGIAKVVIKTREHLAGVKPVKDVLVLELMHFAEELTQPSNLRIPHEAKPSFKELELAKNLVDTMTGPWDPAKYNDQYRSALLEVIHEKIKSGGNMPPAPTGKRKTTAAIDLVDILQQSLAHAQGDGRASQKGKKSSRATLKARRNGKQVQTRVTFDDESEP